MTTVLPVLNTIFAGLGALAAVAGAFIAFAALRISMESRKKAEGAERIAAGATEADARTRTAVADALDDLSGRHARPPQTVGPATGAIPLPDPQAIRLGAIADRLRGGE